MRDIVTPLDAAIHLDQVSKVFGKAQGCSPSIVDG